MNGWSNTVLRVDLTRDTIDKVSLDPDTARRFLGGRGFNSKTLFDEIAPGIDPLSPENVVCFGAGPLSGTGVPLSSRIEVSTLSPYSGILGDGNAGGAFAHRLKRAGCDQIVITGRADRPKYLWIDDDRVELRDASGLWGKTTWDTVDALDAVHGRGVSTACIGPAGENLVRFASTIVDKYNSAARGSGAVLGSKLLKAVAVRGTKPVPAADPEAFGKLVDLDRRFFATDPVQRDKIAVYGTHIGMVEWHPGSRYFKKYLEAEEVPAALRPESWKRFEIGRKGCHGCPVACKNVFRIPEGPRSGETGAALEFEAISCMGVNAGIEDPVAILEYENLADLYGMDVIGLGNTVAFAKKLFELGVITEKRDRHLPRLDGCGGPGGIDSSDGPPGGLRQPRGRGTPQPGEDSGSRGHEVLLSRQGNEPGDLPRGALFPGPCHLDPRGRPPPRSELGLWRERPGALPRAGPPRVPPGGCGKGAGHKPHRLGKRHYPGRRRGTVQGRRQFMGLRRSPGGRLPAL